MEEREGVSVKNWIGSKSSETKCTNEKPRNEGITGFDIPNAGDETGLERRARTPNAYR